MGKKNKRFAEMMSIQKEILTAVINAGGSMDVGTLKAIYTLSRRDAQYNATLVSRGLLEWIRPNGEPVGRAIGIRLTDKGRKIAAALSNEQHTEGGK